MKEAYAQGLESEVEDDGAGAMIHPIDVGHNIYILAHQVRVCVLWSWVSVCVSVCVCVSVRETGKERGCD